MTFVVSTFFVLMKVTEQHVFRIIDGTTDKVSQFIMTMKVIYKKNLF
jgi:hypothetical protein